MPRPLIFGDIEGIEEGHHFQNRREMMPTSFHRNWAAGIDGNGAEGTAAIVLSGGYEDDKDYGDEIIYTGAGGNDPNTKSQIADQSWSTSGNAGLLKSMNEGLPVRVIRGHQHNSSFSPSHGYTYAGLYSVVDAWEEKGASGYKICRFKLIYSGNDTQRRYPESIILDHSIREKKRVEGTVLRIVRDTRISHAVKKMYNFECQICGLTIQTKNGNYAEGAHIQPLGEPHNGDDSLSNILCLCPNHHVMLDRGVISIGDNFEILGNEEGQLNVNSRHDIDVSNLEYHRESHGFK